MTDVLRAEHFKSFEGRHFETEGGPEPFTLVEVSMAPANAGLPDEERPPFTLIFRGPPSPVLPEGTRTFRVEGGTSFTFHAMPIHTPARDRQDYQAVFN